MVFVIPALGKLWGWEGRGGVCRTVAPSGTHHWAAGSTMRGLLRAARWGFVPALGTENPSRISRGSRETHGEDVGFKQPAARLQIRAALTTEGRELSAVEMVINGQREACWVWISNHHRPAGDPTLLASCCGS